VDAAQAGFGARGGGAAGVELHSSVLLADRPRVLEWLQSPGPRGRAPAAAGYDGDGDADGGPCVGRVMVCRARLGAGLAPLGEGCEHGADWGPHLPAQPRRSHQQQQQQQQQQQERTYHIFDPAAVLPEYIATFEYHLAPGSPLAAAARRASAEAAACGAAATPAAAAAALPFEVRPEELAAAEAEVAAAEPALRAACAPLLSWLALSQSGAAPGAVCVTRACAGDEALWTAAAVQAEEAADRLDDGGVAAAAAVVPEPAARLQQLICPGPSAGAALVRLDASCCGLRDADLAPLAALRGATALVLSFNDITSLKARRVQWDAVLLRSGTPWRAQRAPHPHPGASQPRARPPHAAAPPPAPRAAGRPPGIVGRVPQSHRLAARRRRQLPAGLPVAGGDGLGFQPAGLTGGRGCGSQVGRMGGWLGRHACVRGWDAL
jgi:hypothetical protein